MFLGVNAELEIFINENLSVAPIIYHFDFEGEYPEQKTFGYDIGINIYHYYSGHNKSGYFISPYIHYLVKKGSYEADYKNGEYLILGTTFGYQKVFSPAFTSALEIGIATFHDEEGVNLLLGIPSWTVGYNF